MNKKIILIQPQYPSSPFPGARLPVGLGYLAEQLQRADIDYEIVDMNLCHFDELKDRIIKFEPGYIGFTLMSLDINSHYNFISHIKSSYPYAKVIVGGPHVSFLKEEVLQACSAIDIGVVNEGEEAVVEIVKGNNIDELRGVLTRKGNEILYNGDRPFIQELDNIPFPKYAKFDLQKYGKTVDIISSRGCPFGCIFCGAHFSMGKPWRGRSVKSIVDEIEYWYDRGYTHFKFIDSNFFFDKKRIHSLCDILKGKKLNVSIISDGIRADDVDVELLIKMKELGLNSVAIGVESANDEVLKTIKKGEKLSQIETAIKNCVNLDIKVTLFFIIGLPGETKQAVENSFNFALKYPVESAYFFNANPLPKTKFYEWANTNKYLLASPEEMFNNIGGMGTEPLLATPELRFEERKRLYAKGLLISQEVQRRFKARKKRSKLRNIYSEIKNNILIQFVLKHRFDKQADKIVTHLTSKEKLLLKHLAGKISRNGIVLEVGSYLGASACFLASGCRKKNGTVYLVDTWSNDTMSEGLKDTYDEFLKNTKHWKDALIPLRGKSVAIAKNFSKKIDLIFIDADHSYQGCSSDIKAWFPYLKEDAIVVFHDYQWAEGVKAAVAEFVKPIETMPGEVFENMYWTRI